MKEYHKNYIQFGDDRTGLVFWEIVKKVRAFLKIGTLATLSSLIMFSNTPEIKAQNGPNSIINISGIVYGAPTPLTSTTDVSIYDPNGNIFLGNTTTNPSTGAYNISVIPVGLEEQIKKNSEMTVLGNPVMTEANLELTVLNQDNYTLRVFDISGKELYNQRVALSEGDNKITINGLGSPGLKIVEVTDGQKKYTAKVIQTQSTLFAPSIRATPTSGRLGTLKSTNYTTELDIHFTPSDTNYIPNSKIVPAQSAIVNDTVWAKSKTLNKILHVYDLHGMSVKPGGSNIASSYTLKVQFKDGTIIPFTTSNGNIAINRLEYYPNITDTLKFLPDTITNPKFTNEMINRGINHPRYMANIAQTTDPSAYDPLNVVVANMPLESQLYLVPSKVLNPMTMTDSIWTKSTTFRGLLALNDIMSKFVDVTTSRPLYIVIDKWDGYNNAPMSTVQLDRMENEIRKQSDVIPFLANGDSLLPVFIITREDSYNSNIWQQIINRGLNQYLESQYWSGIQPGASVELTFNGSYNGNPIIKNATMRVNPSNANSDIGEEFGHTWFKPDPAGGLGLAGYIYNNDGVTISEFWKTNVRLGLLYDPGVPPLKSTQKGETIHYFDAEKNYLNRKNPVTEKKVP